MRYMKDMNPVSHVPAVRIGIHSGPLVAGVIGKRKFIYDLWGDAVNTAARDGVTRHPKHDPCELRYGGHHKR